MNLNPTDTEEAYNHDISEMNQENETHSNIEPNPQPQAQQLSNQDQSNSSNVGLNNVNVLGGISTAQIQAQQQMLLMAQMMQLGQQQPLVGPQGGNNPQSLAHLVNLQQQQAQLNLLQSMSRAAAGNAMTTNMMGLSPAQLQVNQLLYAGLGGNLNVNMGGMLSNSNQIPNAVPSVAAGTTLTPSENSAAKASVAVASAPRGEDEANDPGWEDQYKALQRYRLVNGHCKVPARYKENPKLGRWVMTQRRQMALMQQGYPNALTVERISKLDDIGFAWTVRPEPMSTWNKKMQELKEYKETFGNTMVPQRYQANPQLGTWVHTQRRQYKLLTDGKKSSMTQDKIDSLNALGFIWVARPSEVDESDGENTEGGSDGDRKESKEDRQANLKTEKFENDNDSRKRAADI